MGIVREYNLSNLLDEANRLSKSGKAGYIGIIHLFLSAITLKDSYSKMWAESKGVNLYRLKENLALNSPSSSELYLSNKDNPVVSNKVKLLIEKFSLEADEKEVISSIFNDVNDVTVALLNENINCDNFSDDRLQKSITTVDKDIAASYEHLGALNRYSRNLTLLAQSGKLHPVIGRDEEIEKICEVLLRVYKSNPILVGEPGVGKTSVVEGLALHLLRDDLHPLLKDLKIFELNTTSLMSGTKYSGELEKRVDSIMKIVQNDPTIVLFIDEFHMIIGMGKTEQSNSDIANMLKPAMSRGDVKIIGATTFHEYNQIIAKEEAMARRLQMIKIREADKKTTFKILKNGILPGFIKHYGISITDDVLEKIIDLTADYMPLEKMPDSVITVLDNMLSRKSLKMGKTLTVDDVQQTIADMADIDFLQMKSTPEERHKAMIAEMKSHIYGQDYAIDMIEQSLASILLKIIDRERPLGRFLFTGMPGTGKTYMAKILAKSIFGSEEKFLSIDMGSYKSEHDISRLIGSPPGYIGYDQGGLLTGFIKSNPNSIILLDEIEKAHPNIYDMMLGLLESGYIKDSSGKSFDAKNVLFILTSNVQIKSGGISDVLPGKSTEPLSIGEQKKKLKKAYEEKGFKPEFIDRIDIIVLFNPLSKDSLMHIAENEISNINKRLVEYGAEVNLTKDILEYFAELSLTENAGARPMKRLIREYITFPVSKLIMNNVNKIVISLDKSDDKFPKLLIEEAR